MSGEYSAHNILVEFQAKGQVDLLGNAGTSVSWIAFLHLYDGIDDFFTGSFGTGLPATTW